MTIRSYLEKPKDYERSASNSRLLMIVSLFHERGAANNSKPVVTEIGNQAKLERRKQTSTLTSLFILFLLCKGVYKFISLVQEPV